MNYKGVWYLPSNSENCVSGFLSFDPLKGIFLELIGAISNDELRNDRPEFILGITSEGEKITLYKCSGSHRSFNTNGFLVADYDALYLFVGGHFQDREELMFNSISFQFSDFDNWLGIFGAQITYKGKGIHIEYDEPPKIEYNIADNIRCEIKFESTYPSKRTSKVTMTQECEVHLISLSGRRSVKDLLDWFGTFRALVALAYYGDPVVEKLNVHVNQNPEGEELHIKPISIYYKARGKVLEPKGRAHRYSFLFTFESVRNNFELILNKWYESKQIIGPIMAALSEAFFQVEGPVESKFLNLAHAIETYHRRLKRNEDLPESEHMERLKLILKGVPEAYQAWLQEKLQFSNEVTLHNRLVELIKGFPREIQQILFKPTIEEFVKKFKHSRNYYTHYSQYLEKKALNLVDLYAFSERLKVFLICLLLMQIGFSDDELKQAILRHGLFLFNHVVDVSEVQALFSNIDQQGDKVNAEET